MPARRFAILLPPLLLGTLSAALPSRAQQPLSASLAFADTTLLRDTLGLSFARLFALSDSLELLPDTLRALAVRYRLAPERLVELADSLRAPVDSVGPILDRERFNPLASHAERVNAFSYNTTYNVQQTSTSWGNHSDYNLVLGPLFVRNAASIQLDRFRSGLRTNVRQTRSSTTETGWKLFRDYSVGARAILTRFDSDDPSTITQIGESSDEFHLSVRTRQQPTPNLSSELNLFSGLLDLANSAQEKRGLSNELRGQIKYSSGRWLVQEVRGHVKANLGRTLDPQSGERRNTRDLIQNLSGSASLFADRSVALRSSFLVQRTRVATRRFEGSFGNFGDLRTSSSNLDATLRLRLTDAGTINVTPRIASSDQVTASNGPSSRTNHGLAADGRYVLRGWALESRFAVDQTGSEAPQLTAAGGYGETSQNRSLDGSLARQLLPRLSARATARIGLSSYRYRVIGAYGTPPVSRDQAQQSYRVQSSYTFSERFNSGVALEVARSQTVNLPSASTAANHTLRTYRAEWRWTYRLLRGLTATQQNTLGANYTAYTFVPQNDRVALEYSTATTLNAILGPRLSIDLVHSSQIRPSGNYTRHVDGQYYFRPADENREYSLTGRMAYTPWPGFSLSLAPVYRSSDREGTLNDVPTPQRRSASLNFQGSASLNLRVAGRGHLSGSIGRTHQTDRSTAFVSGIPQVSPRGESNFWNGSLQFSWQP